MIAKIEQKNLPQHPYIYQDTDFEFSVEDTTIGWVIHCNVFVWNKSVYIKMLHGLAEVVAHAPHGSVYAVAKDEKLIKFASMFGMESIDTIRDSEGAVLGELLCL